MFESSFRDVGRCWMLAMVTLAGCQTSQEVADEVAHNGSSEQAEALVLGCERGALSFERGHVIPGVLQDARVLAGRIGKHHRLVWVAPDGAIATAHWDGTAALLRGPVPGPLVGSTLADIDGDGMLDIVTVHGGDAASLRWIDGQHASGDADAVLEHVLDLGDDLGSPARQAVFGRFDGDALVDTLVVGDARSLLLSGGASTDISESPVSFSGSSWVAARRSHSHRHAALAVHPSGRVAEIDVHGKGADPIFTSGIVSGSDRSIHSGDIDGDGRSDLLVARFADGAISALLDVLETRRTVGLDLRENFSGSTLADLDGDGLDDLLLWNEDGAVSVVRWPRVQSPQVGVVVRVGVPIASVAVHDVDRDGLRDLVVSTVPGTAHVFRARCDCEAGWSGPRCRACADGCEAVGGDIERLWISTPARLRGPVREVAKELAAVAAPGEPLTTAQVANLQTLAWVIYHARLTAVVRTGDLHRLSVDAHSVQRVEMTARVESVVRGRSPAGDAIRLRVSDPSELISEAPRPPPPHARVLAAMVETDDGWALAHSIAVWRIQAGDEVEVGTLRVPLDSLRTAIARALGETP